MQQKTGIMATLAIVAAVGSFFLTFSGHRVSGIVAAILSIPFGVMGLAMAASPRVSGGILSIVAILLGVFAAGFGVLAMVGAVLI